MHRSREADIVVWDALNYPSLRMEGHSFFFADAVRLVVEVKSRWSEDEFADIRAKSRAVRDIIVHRTAPDLDDTLKLLAMDQRARDAGHHGLLSSPHHIGTAALVLEGGQSLVATAVSDDLIRMADDEWPDVVMLLGAGRIVLKQYEGDGFNGVGCLEFIDAGDDALLLFTDALLRRLVVRSVHVETPLELSTYVDAVLPRFSSTTVPFSLTRPMGGRVPLWRR